MKKNSEEFKESLKAFYKDNKHVNPIQIHYIIETFSMYEHLECIDSQKNSSI